MKKPFSNICIGKKVVVKCFSNIFRGTIVDYGSKGCKVRPDVVEQWMSHYLEDGLLDVYYELIVEGL